MLPVTRLMGHTILSRILKQRRTSRQFLARTRCPSAASSTRRSRLTSLQCRPADPAASHQAPRGSRDGAVNCPVSSSGGEAMQESGSGASGGVASPCSSGSAPEMGRQPRNRSAMVSLPLALAARATFLAAFASLAARFFWLRSSHGRGGPLGVFIRGVQGIEFQIGLSARQAPVPWCPSPPGRPSAWATSQSLAAPGHAPLRPHRSDGRNL